MKKKLDAVLTEGNMKLPYPSQTENVDKSSRGPLSPNSQLKRMPALGNQSPPQIPCMTSSNQTASGSNISPGVT